MAKHFVKVKEDFVCEHCGFRVKGTGYTNHCPNCLWSKHVDEEVPGDRQSKCLGLMEPIGVRVNPQQYLITHQCQKCGKRMNNKSAKNDNFEVILDLSKKIVK
jgi:hypothetical protein